jgi:hypothetical protein
MRVTTGVPGVDLTSGAFQSVCPSFASRANRHPQERMMRSPRKTGDEVKCSSSSAVSTIRTHFGVPRRS